MGNIAKKYAKAMEKAYKLLQTKVEIHTRIERSSVDFDDIFGDPVDPDDPTYTTRVHIVQGIGNWSDGTDMRRLPAGVEGKEVYLLHVRLKDVIKDPSNPNSGTLFDDAEKVIVEGRDECKVVTARRRVGIHSPFSVFVVLERAT